MKMKFITESYLRELYKKEPFTDFVLRTGTRLTPGGRQYLTDKGIKMHDSSIKKISGRTKQQAEELSVPENKVDWKRLQFHSRLKSTEALFLLTCEELLGRDVVLAHHIVKLYKQFSSIKNAVNSLGTVENLPCNDCTGIMKCNFSSNLGDCFEITEFHMQLEKGRELLLLHRLRCALQELEPLMLELSDSDNEEKAWNIDMIGKVNQVINTLSQYIHKTIGGTECLRLLNTATS
ncbi:cobalamin adenosyltransferase [Neobacillus sp. DY30]|uniref:cobalamin adenosyltransferase n=1 Tax=Neobacillus sp. DY30 TaxID=3047871 RepID=UPI0024BF6BD0|nr:cobalamin adenosyltransferase [Neobacillus sp. DY30]WHY02512.1 cobalamin adenosyltransferase [Neobacillus sp. DY30]